MSNTSSKSLSYKDAGVDIARGNQLVEDIRDIVERTRRPEVLHGLGGFGALFELPLERYRRPVLVSGTDGVGTKLKLAIDSGIHDSIGIDLVAMCANDLVVQGAEPLFFLDYYATGALELGVARSVVKGIGAGCEQAGMSLIGGETAEMPGMYSAGDYDLAGFCVGIVEKDALIDGHRVQPGDAIIGIASSGPHSNGYSLIRKVIAVAGADTSDELDGRPLLEHLLAPTRIYVKSLLSLIDAVPVHALAHITGGGLTENLPRVMPAGTVAELRADSWQRPVIFDWLQEQGRIADPDMYLTFNCGVGMVAIVPEDHAEQAVRTLNGQGENAWRLGVIATSGSAQASVEIR